MDNTNYPTSIVLPINYHNRNCIVGSLEMKGNRREMFTEELSA